MKPSEVGRSVSVISCPDYRGQCTFSNSKTGFAETGFCVFQFHPKYDQADQSDHIIRTSAGAVTSSSA